MGSARSIAGLPLRDAHDRGAKEAPGVLERYGGHAFAAGASLAEARLPAFATAFEQVARATITPEHLRRVHPSDGPLPPGALTFALAQSLRACVWGQGLPSPAFDDEFDVTGQRQVGERHQRFSLERSGERFEAIAFNQPTPLPGRVRALYRPEVGEWNGLLSLELVVEHWEAVG
jgi:single-stranded-DNA-specific exonuclease